LNDFEICSGYDSRGGPPARLAEDPQKPCGGGAFLLATHVRKGIFPMWRTLLAGKSLVVDDDFSVVLFLSLAGLDLSLWLLGRGFFAVI
jgi:hypothetical protein